ncbi:hypothetical protein ACFQE5_04870 [Pseudonocardia hispaniensis]|uniref:Uncharacterized protein n=1 Tax=Pseudonocardia hispaniensis TaxID=904933 RepID=A0ABW1IYL6_9PSEU
MTMARVTNIGITVIADGAGTRLPAGASGDVAPETAAAWVAAGHAVYTDDTPAPAEPDKGRRRDSSRRAPRTGAAAPTGGAGASRRGRHAAPDA